jgi:hypothetical protein
VSTQASAICRCIDFGPAAATLCIEAPYRGGVPQQSVIPPCKMGAQHA